MFEMMQVARELSSNIKLKDGGSWRIAYLLLKLSDLLFVSEQQGLISNKTRLGVSSIALA